MNKHQHPLFGRGHGPQGAEQHHEQRHHHDDERHYEGNRHHGQHGGGRGRGHGDEHSGPFGGRRFGQAFGGGPFGEGAFGGGRGRARRGEARHFILDALKDGPRHGYEIIKALEEKSSGQYTPSAGTVYPVLQHLEDLGLVRADQEADRRVYAITDAGRTDLEAHAEEVAAFWARFAVPQVSAASQAEVQFLQDEFHDIARTLWSGLRGVIDAGDSGTVRRVRLALERCKNEIRGIIAGQDETTANE